MFGPASSPVKSLREDVQIDHRGERWRQILENLYVCFRVSPYGSPKVRAVKKERKLYLWDWSSVEDSGPRFENLVACQLLKYCHWVEDTEGYSMELRYLRDTDKREVDFVVLKERRPLFAVECKSGEKAVSPAIRYFADRTPIPHFYQVHLGERHVSTGKVTVPLPALHPVVPGASAPIARLPQVRQGTRLGASEPHASTTLSVPQNPTDPSARKTPVTGRVRRSAGHVRCAVAAQMK